MAHLRVNWMAHCGGSMGIEALHLLGGLEGRVPLRTQIFRPWEDCEHTHISDFPAYSRDMYQRLHQISLSEEDEVLVYHRDPSLITEVMGGLRPQYVVGRFMFEGEGALPKTFLDACHFVNEVWVPSAFHQRVLGSNGVDASKIHIIPEAVPGEVMAASAYEPLPVMGVHGFVFLSVFKFEDRKGWRELVHAYCAAFSSADNVTLLLHTYLYNPPEELKAKSLWDTAVMHRLIDDHLSRVGCGTEKNRRPTIVFTGRSLTHFELLRLYRTADAYVSAHWGEGWGLPLSEAMAMGLPTVATNYSGNTEFMTADNSWLIPVAEIVEYQHYTQFAGLKHAIANVSALTSAMRQLHRHPQQAQQRSERGRVDILERFSPVAVGELILKRLLEIEKRIHAPMWIPTEVPPLSIPPARMASRLLSIGCPRKRKESTAPYPRPLEPAALAEILIISSYPPKPCGIAMFSFNLRNALLAAMPASFKVPVVAVQRPSERFEYASEVVGVLMIGQREECTVTKEVRHRAA